MRSVLTGMVEHREFWENEILQRLANCIACFQETTNLGGLVMDSVNKIVEILRIKIFGCLYVVLLQLDIHGLELGYGRSLPGTCTVLRDAVPKNC